MERKKERKKERKIEPKEQSQKYKISRKTLKLHFEKEYRNFTKYDVLGA